MIAPQSFQTKQTRSSFYSNRDNDKTRARILKENDFKESEKADTRNLKSDLKIANYHTVHNRGIGMLKRRSKKWIKKRIRISISLLRSANFFFQANVRAAKEIIPGDNLFLLPTLRCDKLQRLLLSQRQPGLFFSEKHPRPEVYGWTVCFDGYFS